MIRRLSTAICFFISLVTCFGQDLSFYYPSIGGELVKHAYYALDYNEDHEHANWVLYFSGVHGVVERKDAFKGDAAVTTGSATLNDYVDSGYDRGHLAPAADMNVSKISMKESFFMSNMSPQLPGFNRGVWKRLESLVRAWGQAIDSDSDVIITGPLLNESCGTIGNNVTVPCSYYKIYADLNTGKAIGFILKNESSLEDLSSFAVSIDQIEIMSGIDFFPALENAEEEKMESHISIADWDWKAKPIVTTSESSDDQLLVLQCKGVIGSGKQCSRKAGESGYCWQHK